MLRGELGTNRRLAFSRTGAIPGDVGNVRTQFIFMKCVLVHHGIPAVLHPDVPWLHRHSENGAYIMLVFRDIWCMCCVYIRNVQHHIDSIVLKAVRKEILVFHIREQLRLRQTRTFETKMVWSRSKLFGTLTSLLLKYCFRNS